MFRPRTGPTKQVVVPVKASGQNKQASRRPSTAVTAAQRTAQRATQAREQSPLRPTANGVRKRIEKSRGPSTTLKRSRNGTPQTPDWADDDDDEEDAEESLDLEQSSKRAKHDSVQPDHDRHTWSIPTESSDLAGLVHAGDFTSTGTTAAIYKPFGAGDTEAIRGVELRYPSQLTERFQLMYPDDGDEYRPVRDICQSVEAMIKHYFPGEGRDERMLDEDGFPRRFTKAVNHRSLAEFNAALNDFNRFMEDSVKVINAHLQTQHTVNFEIVEQVLANQSYPRTVGPHVAKLKVRKDELGEGKSKTYGEITPRFAHDMFIKTKLRSGQVFVDLGSGVGNVVLQAAIETGAESHGIEIVDTPAQCAATQQKDFEARCKLWGIKPGAVSLYQGDFLKSDKINDALKRADVVLVNNRVFEPSLNDKLMLKFLDLKEGCKIISLESFVPEKWELKINNMEDVRNVLKTRREWYGENRVSWANEGGWWYIATKDSSEVQRFAAKTRRRG